MHHNQNVRWMWLGGRTRGKLGCAVERLTLLLAILALALPLLSRSASGAEAAGVVSEAAIRQIFPNATRIGPMDGAPPAWAVYEAGRLVGYAFSTTQVANSTGFSGKPLDILAGVGADGVIKGAHILRHEEPILIIGISEGTLNAFVASFAGADVRERISIGEVDSKGVRRDAISGATISSSVITDAILRSARAVARARGLIEDEARSGARVDRETFEEAGWQELLADGSVARLTLTNGQVNDAFDAVTPSRKEPPYPINRDDVFIDLYAALASPPRIGQNLLGGLAFNDVLGEIGADDYLVLIGAEGRYSFKGTGFARGGVFDRIQLVQGVKTIRMTRGGYRNLEGLKSPADDAPVLRELGLFVVPADTGFDPLSPWRIDLLVSDETQGGGMISQTFSLDYALPDRYRVGEADTAEPSVVERLREGATLWPDIWQKRMPTIAALCLMLLVLSAVLVLQDRVSANARFHRRFRLVFLGVTFVWLGLLVGGQLSVINVLTFVHAIMSGFQWEYFLLDPVVFILWSFVAMAMLFWGRGVFCGWLCPFGALQEILSELARRAKVPQIHVPFALHERLWPIKYIVFLGLIAVSLHSMLWATYGAEVEPFKTVISLKFMRSWPFVLYAALLLFAGLFIERFFCRYLCPLGAALAIPARLRMFDWLKRRYECGRDCKICADRCTVQAIHPNGGVNPNECIHCLGCQTNYFDDTTCPPLIAWRKRRDQRVARQIELAAREDASS